MGLTQIVRFSTCTSCVLYGCISPNLNIFCIKKTDQYIRNYVHQTLNFLYLFFL